MIRRISILSGISIFAVVLNHAISFGLWALYAWTGQYANMLPENYNPLETPQWFFLIFSKQLLTFCVPAFFLITGYFICYAIDKSSGNVRPEIIRNRVKGLIPPFIIWTSVSVILDAALGSITRPVEFLLPFLGINGFWFIPTIVLFYLMARGTVFLAQKNWKLLLIGAAVVQLLMVILKYVWFVNIQNSLLNYILAGNFDTLIINYLFYFPLGVVLGLKSTTFKSWINQYRAPLLVGCAIFMIVGLYIGGWTLVYVSNDGSWTDFIGQIVTHFYSLTIILVFLAFDEVKIPFASWFSKLSSKSYGIYLSHYLFMLFFSKMIYNFFPSLLYFQLLFTGINIAIGLSGSLVLMNLVSKSPIQRGYAYLFG